eukprot:9483217-Pyramimonas_sp.AAC.1
MGERNARNEAWCCPKKKCGFKADFSWMQHCCKCGAARPLAPAPAQQQRGPQGVWANGPLRSAVARPKHKHLEPAQLEKIARMSNDDFEVCKRLLSPPQRARVAAQRALAAGDPRAVQRHAQSVPDDLKKQIGHVSKQIQKVESEMQSKVLELVKLKDNLTSLEGQERVASAKASAAWAQCAAGGAGVVDASGAAVSADDPAFALLMQFQSLDADLARSLRSLLETRESLLPPAHPDDEAAADDGYETDDLDDLSGDGDAMEDAPPGEPRAEPAPADVRDVEAAALAVFGRPPSESPFAPGASP